ncbi:uncharacterized protein [Temnothorax longispinosus]|uniref:uncharacterized protein isoform X8 n=1 Tax=Temnothorax longispinosus TaxID=300112 RepID=UPI003A99461A
MERPTATACAPGPRVKVPTPAAGISASRCLVFIPGLAGPPTRDNGRTARDTVWVWRLVAVGFIEENGLRDSKVVTGFGSLLPLRRDTRARGPAACRTVTAPRLMPTATAIPNQYGPGQMNQYNSQSMYAQQTHPSQYQPDGIMDAARPPSSTSLRRNSRVLSPQDRPGTIGQTLNDRLDHYKRPPSRDSSVDRYARAHSRLTGSRQPSVDKTISNPPPDMLDRSTRAPSAIRAGTPLNGSVIGSGAATPTYNAPTPSQFEGALIKNRGLGQDILPSPGQPKRTESLYVAPTRGPSGGGGGGIVPKAMPVAAMPLQRKKSLPDVAQPIQLTATAPLSREEVSILSSMRREEIRRQIDESERLRANPLLYLVSPQVKDWFSRQQLVMLVLFINISLALMFFKLLT